MKKLLSRKRAYSIIKGFSKARVLVIGDLIMDHFIWGKVTRISPEAPVPVVNVTKETILLGGSANVVNNVYGLGGKPFVAGIVGKDADGKKLIEMLKEKSIPTNGIITDKKKPTTIKTRIIAHQQQIVRFDREKKDSTDGKTLDNIFSYIKRAIGFADAVVISDYSKGLITKKLVEFVIAAAEKSGKPVLVDPKVEHFDYYKGVTIVTPNNLEAGNASGIEIEDARSLKKAGRIICDMLDCKALLITRGEHGMTLFEGKSEVHIPTVAREVYDVSGAGDTVIGALALSLAAGANFKEASVISNLAAGIVVGKLGTATVSPMELKRAISETL